CIERWEVTDGKREPTEDDVNWVKRRYSEFLSSAEAQVSDRSVHAFTTPASRAAWKSYTEGRYDDALNYYEMAALEDADNAWFFDRYAYTLMRMRKLEIALEKSKRAVLLQPNDPDI